MFDRVISPTPFVTAAAESVFSKIVEPYRPPGAYADATMLTTLRALVTPRLPEGESITLKWGVWTDGVIGKDRIVATASPGTFYVSLVCNDLAMDYIERNFAGSMPGLRQLETVSAFFRKVMRVLCFVRSETKEVYVFVKSQSLPHVHFLQCAIPAMLPWYFDPEEGLSEKEMALLRSLTARDSEEYIKLIAEMAEKYDLRGAHIRAMLQGFESRLDERDIKGAKAEIENIEGEIEAVLRRIGSLTEARRERLIRYDGLKKRLADQQSGDALMAYFLRNPALHLEDVRGESVEFAVKTYIEFFDAAMAERAINNVCSDMYYIGKDHGFAEQDIEMLMRALFAEAEPRLKLKTCAAYCLDPQRAIGLLDYPFSDELSDAMPNPHIQRHGCLGGYAQELTDLLMRGDYVAAVATCVASCKSLNFADGVVMEEFYGSLFNRRGRRCIELPDGRVVNAQEAIEWLKQEGGNEQEEAKTEEEGQHE